MKTKNAIKIIRIIGNNLILGKGLEQSICLALSHLPSSEPFKEKGLKLINLGFSYPQIFKEMADFTEDKSLSRIWILLSKMSILSSYETGRKFVEIAENLEINRQKDEKRKSLVKAQRYKSIFLGSITSVFLGILASFAPLFTNFISLIRDHNVSPLTLFLIPFSLYLISLSSVYFLNKAIFNRFSFKALLLSSGTYALSFLLVKGFLFFLDLPL
ncbi:MAG: hypothetical protein GF308_15545 [Candidatus Heimdallarchaeota archaeon]|nr:hypothetical protein [Candidatus Heimdallarchaeota archaeon]